MDPTQQLAQALAVLSLYVLVPLLLILAPVVWCVWRVMSDIRGIRSALWHIAYVMEHQPDSAPAPAASKPNGAAIAQEPRVSNSAFGR